MCRRVVIGADEYMHHGYILYDQLLRVWALELAGVMLHDDRWVTKAAQIRVLLQQNFWNNQQSELYSPNLKHQLENAPMSFWFLGFNPSRIYPQFDLQANTLALLLNLGDEIQTRTVIDVIAGFEASMKSLIPSFYTTIRKTDADMAELRNNYAYQFRNHPFEFHNGGLWPVWNGGW